MKKLKITLISLSVLISILFLCFVYYGHVKSNLMDSEVALPLISIWAFRISELLIDYFKVLFAIQTMFNLALIYLIIGVKPKSQ